LLLHSESGGHRLRDQLCIGQRRQLHEPRPIRILPEGFARHLEGQPGLAGAAHSDQGEKPGLSEPLADLGQLSLSSDEAGELDRQVVRVNLQ
jgi:hypothetical protein